ncbi:hypothetical protein D9Q98_008454 [Chlorella vulgaris]|uniref:Methyltransferase domain-containing protein n=1 Tax=Chlorella vulgaris TaxID=3077 RepID=A0A9D4YT34_CHLVU|nr:hypothetical protein D9Q98_008454 [Chlorella vulgaris]
MAALSMKDAELPAATTPSALASAGDDAGARDDASAPAGDEHTQLQERMASYFIGALTSNLVALGDKLGLYAALKTYGPCTAGELAEHLDLNERYCAEWLRQQASAKLVSTDEAAEEFWLTRVQQDCLVHETGSEASPFFFGGGFMAIPGLAKTADEKLPACFKDGTGISYAELDQGLTCGVCRELGVWMRHALVPSLKSLPGLEEKLQKGCKVADVGCGCGMALCIAAAAFPASTFHGYDIADDALRLAREEAGRRGLTNVEFFNAGLAEEAMPTEPTYQLIQTHDAIHDMAHPEPVMAAVRKAVAADGCWVIGDMSAMDSHAANVHNHPLAPFLYGFSVHLCLPSGMSAPEGAALGTLGIPSGKMCAMLRDAGFGTAEVLESWNHPLNRYYIAKP